MFFTNIFGLSFADAATLMLIARLFDVVTDPIMGSLADRMQSRWGTYRPFLIFGALPFGLVFALLLQTPDFDATGKRIYAYTMYLLMMAIYTLVNVPYGSLLGVMTDDDNEKNQFSSFRMVGAYAMGFITLMIFPYLQKLVGGSSQHQYSMLGIIFGVVAAVLTLACGLMTKERLKPKRAEKYSGKQFVDLVKNVPWLYLTGTSICTNFFNGFRYAAAGYMFTYCLNGDITIGKLIINYTVFMTFGELTCMVFGGLSPWFTKKIGSKKKTFMFAAVICASVLCPVLLHTYEGIMDMGDDSSGSADVHGHRYLLAVAMVDVFRRGRLRYRKERNIINGTDFLFRNNGPETWHSHIGSPRSTIPRTRRREHDHRQDGQLDCRSQFHHPLGVENDMVAFLYHTGSNLCDYAAFALQISNKEIVNTYDNGRIEKAIPQMSGDQYPELLD